MCRGVIYSLKSCEECDIRYIGQTIQELSKRLYQHMNQSIKHNNHLGYWLKNLDKCPLIEIIEECNCEDLNKKELYWIKYYENNKLVNSIKGCELSGHHTHSEETKRKIGESTTRIHTGLKRTEEARHKMSLKAKNRKHSKESIEKRKKTLKYKNYKCSQETKDKISKANKGKVFSEEHINNISIAKKKPLYVLNVTNLEYQVTCIKDFAKLLGVFPNSINSRLNKYPNKVYREQWLLTKDYDEFKKLLNQLGIYGNTNNK